MTRQIAKIRNNLDEVTVKITPERIKCRLINDSEIDDNSFIWEVFDHCPLAALRIVNGKYDIAEDLQLYFKEKTNTRNLLLNLLGNYFLIIQQLR